MSLIKSAKSGNWNDTTVWTGGACPNTGDTWEIQNGHNITIAAELTNTYTGAGTIDNGGTLTPAFQMATSYINGNITVNSGGQIYASRALSSVLRVQGQILANGTNSVNYGTSVDPISNPVVGAFIQFVCASDNLTSRGISTGITNSVTFYGAARVMQSYLQSSALINATSIVLHDDMVLRSGALAGVTQGTVDMIVVGQNPTISQGAGAQNYQIEAFLVNNYVAGTKTVTLADAGAGQSYWPRGGTSGNSYAGLGTARAVNTPVWLISMNVGIVGSAYNLRPTNGINCRANDAVTFTNASMWWCYYGINAGSGHTLTTPTFNGNYIGIIYGSGHTLTTPTFSGNTYGINYGVVLIYGGSFATSTNGDLYDTLGYAVGTTFGSTPQMAGNNILNVANWHFFESQDDGGVSGAYKSWSYGGIVTSDAGTVFDSSRTRSYKLACADATHWGFRQEEVQIEAGATLNVRCYIRKDTSMATLPNVQIVDPFQDPLASGSFSALASAAMTDSINTWETLYVSYTNTGTRKMKLLVRCAGMSATGNVWFDDQIVFPGSLVNGGVLTEA